MLLFPAIKESLRMKILKIFIFIALFFSFQSYSYARCSTLTEVQKRHENDMFLHKKTNKMGKIEYVWVRSGTRGDIEFVYHLNDGKLCLYEKYQY